MKERLIGLTSTAAVAPVAIFGYGVKHSEFPDTCKPESSHNLTLESSSAPLAELRLNDLPNGTKVVVTLAAVAVAASGINKWQRGKDYGDDWQKRTDKLSAAASTALGIGITVATWIP